MNKRRYVILDRDGTVIVEKDYLADPDGVQIIHGAAQGIRRMLEVGLGVIIVTNQSGVGRGYFDENTVDEIHQRMQKLLLIEDIKIDGIFYCPHTPEDNCSCRKPKTGLIKQAAKELNFKPSECFVIGDKACDVSLGKNIGAVSFLVRTGYGAEEAQRKDIAPDYIVNDLLEAAVIINETLDS
jgi:D-glycero-D-manno-heptose 1,7-bisphosphate phosphatase